MQQAGDTAFAVKGPDSGRTDANGQFPPQGNKLFLGSIYTAILYGCTGVNYCGSSYEAYNSLRGGSSRQAPLGALLGGFLGGMLGGSATKAGMDKLIEDDAVMIMAIVSEEFKLIAASFCFNDEEIKLATVKWDSLISETNGFVEEVFSRKQYKRHYVARLLRPIFIEICIDRPVLYEENLTPEAIETAIGDA